VAGTLLPDRVTDLPVRVLNVSNRPVSLHKGSTVSKLAAVTTEGPLGTAEDSFSPEDNKIIEEMVSRVSPDLRDSTRDHLRQLLRKYNHVFSKNENDLGWTDLVTHHRYGGQSSHSLTTKETSTGSSGRDRQASLGFPGTGSRRIGKFAVVVERRLGA